MAKNRGTALKFEKARSMNQIPRYLFEQVKPITFDIDRLYAFGDLIIKNPTNIMGVLIDKQNNVKGVLWVSYNIVTDRLTVQVLSIDKEYYGKGIMNEIKGILKKLKNNIGASVVDGLTSRPKAIEKLMGFKKSKIIIMEQ
jgi:hypothetical protein